MSELEVIYAPLGRRIAKLRLSKNMTQTVLGQAIGMTRFAICLIEKGRNRILLHDLIIVAATLGTTAAKLIAEHERARRREAKGGV